MGSCVRGRLRVLGGKRSMGAWRDDAARRTRRGDAVALVLDRRRRRGYACAAVHVSRRAAPRFSGLQLEMESAVARVGAIAGACDRGRDSAQTSNLT